MMLVERPDYRIDNHTIKRGSRPSILIVSFVERSKLWILGIIFIVSYLALTYVSGWCLSCSSWQAQLLRKRISYASSIVFSVLEILPVHPCGRSHSSNSLQNLHCLFSIFSRVAFVVLFPTKLISPLSDFMCKRYGVSGLQERGLSFHHLVLSYIFRQWCFSA